MKFSPIAIFAATAVSGAALEKKQATFYSVTEFSASCTPHSTFCNYYFLSQASGAQKYPVACEVKLQGPDKLPSVPLTPCSSPYISFAVTRGDSGLDLNITSILSTNTNVTGTYHIPSSNITTDQNGAVTDERYTGPTQFEALTSLVTY